MIQQGRSRYEFKYKVVGFFTNTYLKQNNILSIKNSWFFWLGENFSIFTNILVILSYKKKFEFAEFFSPFFLLAIKAFLVLPLSSTPT